MSKQTRKPVKWVSSAKRDLDAMPDYVKDVFGHAIDLAQASGKHQDAKVMTGFGRPACWGDLGFGADRSGMGPG